MAKRKPSKRKPVGLRAKLGISKKRYDNLMREAENARRRIRAFEQRVDANNYFIPDAQDYTIAALAERLLSGESYASIMREVKNQTATKIKSGVPSTIQTESGLKIKPSEQNKLKQSVAQANQLIREARAKYPDFAEHMPAEFDYSTIVESAYTENYIRNQINDINKFFTPENLRPGTSPIQGEPGTMAEYLYFRAILERENQRREEMRKENETNTKNGFFKQSRYDDRDPIDIDAIQTRERLIKRAITWDDPARIYRANLFLGNYERTWDTFYDSLTHHIGENAELDQKVERMKKIIDKLYFNEKAITFASMRTPSVDISLISGQISGNVSLDEIFDAWDKVAAEYNIKV